MSGASDDFRARLRAALQASKEIEETFEKSPLRTILAKDANGNFTTPTENIPSLLFNDSSSSAASILIYLRANGDELILEEYGAYLMKQFALRADGTLDLTLLDTWESRYRSALSVLPGLQSKLDSAREAKEKVEHAIANKEAALDYIRLSPAMLYVEHDPMPATEKLFALPDTAEAIRALLERMAGNREAFEGLQKCVIDYILQKVGVTHDRAAQYITFIHTHERALAELFDETKMQTFRNVAADLRSIR